MLLNVDADLLWQIWKRKPAVWLHGVKYWRSLLWLIKNKTEKSPFFLGKTHFWEVGRSDGTEDITKTAWLGHMPSKGLNQNYLLTIQRQGWVITKKLSTLYGIFIQNCGWCKRNAIFQKFMFRSVGLFKTSFKIGTLTQIRGAHFRNLSPETVYRDEINNWSSGGTSPHLFQGGQ